MPTIDNADPHDLQRFLDQQDPVYEDVCAELRMGSKGGHWMWYVFPQLKGLGSSYMAETYGIASIEEAKAYLNHPILGSRLRHCTRLVIAIDDKSARQIFGYVDALKFRSCMTLFQLAATDADLFAAALQKYYGGELDDLTVKRLSAAAGHQPMRRSPSTSSK